MTDYANATCRVEGCGGPRSGICINKLAFDECPDVILADGEAAAPAPESGQSTEEFGRESIVATNVGDSLDAEGADRLLRIGGGKLIGIVAGPEAGKTTLVATIYELIHRAKIDGFGFAGSETLRGYEERCHLARMASNASKADTARTKTWEELSFTHLKLAVEDRHADLLFSDRSGEHFDNVLDTPTGIAAFQELARADHIWLVVDLERLSQSGHVLKSQLRRLVMAIQSAGLFAEKEVAVVGTKADIFALKRTRTTIEKDLAALAEDLESRIVGMRSFATHVVACRPPKQSTDFGTGIAKLVASLIPAEDEADCALRFPLPDDPSELDRIAARLETRS